MSIRKLHSFETYGLTITVDDATGTLFANGVAIGNEAATIAQALVGDGAITVKQGNVIISKGTAAAITLAAPVAGDPVNGGDDGKTFVALSTTAAAHVITAPANKINSNKITATFGAAIGNFVIFIAYNGIWYVIGSTGITLA